MSAPVISGGVYDVNETTTKLTNNSSKLIKHHSTARAVMSAEAQNGASIDSVMYVIRNGGRTKFGSICDFENVEDEVFHFSAQDSRGNIGSKTVEADMIDYVQLTCNIGSITPDASGNVTLSCYGNYFNGTFGAKDNSLLLAYGYADSNGNFVEGEMEDVNIYSNNTYSASINLSGLDYQETYTFYVNAKDELEQVDSTKNGVTTKPIFHWGKNDFTFEVPVKINGDTLYIGDNCYIREATDNDLTIKATELILNADSISLNADISTPYGSIECGEWTPQLYPPDAVNGRYEVQKGWYQKVGNVVTIGWQIKADTKSIYNSSLVMIMDFDKKLPRPSSDAFGGGVAFNVYTTEDFIFEGWSINTSGIITARLQSCEKYESGNLEISSHCYYPAESDEMQVSLAGTICYLTNG